MLGVYLSQGWPPGSQLTELADLKTPGALEAVDGVPTQVDSGAMTAGEAIELVLQSPSSRCATTERGRCQATCWRPSIGVMLGGPAALSSVGRR